MNTKLVEIIQGTIKSLPVDNKNLEKWIDDFVIEVSRRVTLECSNVVRENAKNQTDDNVKLVLKSTAMDILDHFGV